MYGILFGFQGGQQDLIRSDLALGHLVLVVLADRWMDSLLRKESGGQDEELHVELERSSKTTMPCIFTSTPPQCTGGTVSGTVCKTGWGVVLFWAVRTGLHQSTRLDFQRTVCTQARLDKRDGVPGSSNAHGTALG